MAKDGKIKITVDILKTDYGIKNKNIEIVNHSDQCH